jgi:hypothetical protein
MQLIDSFENIVMLLEDDISVTRWLVVKYNCNTFVVGRGCIVPTTMFIGGSPI